MMRELARRDEQEDIVVERRSFGVQCAADWIVGRVVELTNALMGVRL
jgi:hypothetical protein